MDNIRDVARRAAIKAARQIDINGGSTLDGRSLGDFVADAVAVAVLWEAKEQIRSILTPYASYAQAERTIDHMLAAFTPAEPPQQEDNRCFKHAQLDCGLCAPAEPPQQETEVLRAPTNRADTVADPRGLDLADPMDRHTVYALSSRSSAPDTVEVIASFVEHLRDGYQSTTEPVAKVARLIRERFGKR
jgi:hypothetical protein